MPSLLQQMMMAFLRNRKYVGYKSAVEVAVTKAAQCRLIEHTEFDCPSRNDDRRQRPVVTVDLTESYKQPFSACVRVLNLAR